MQWTKILAKLEQCNILGRNIAKQTECSYLFAIFEVEHTQTRAIVRKTCIRAAVLNIWCVKKIECCAARMQCRKVKCLLLGTDGCRQGRQRRPVKGSDDADDWTEETERVARRPQNYQKCKLHLERACTIAHIHSCVRVHDNCVRKCQAKRAEQKSISVDIFDGRDNNCFWWVVCVEVGGLWLHSAVVLRLRQLSRLLANCTRNGENGR